MYHISIISLTFFSCQVPALFLLTYSHRIPTMWLISILGHFHSSFSFLPLAFVCVEFKVYYRAERMVAILETDDIQPGCLCLVSRSPWLQHAGFYQVGAETCLLTDPLRGQMYVKYCSMERLEGISIFYFTNIQLNTHF